MVYDWILGNKEILKIIYALIVVFVCSIIVLKTDRLFKISDYQGLRYFRNSFFFFGIAFLTRYILGLGGGEGFPPYYSSAIKILFEFFIIVAGLLLFYSLIWKRVEKSKHYHSFFNLNMFVLYSVALIITIASSIFNGGGIMCIFQVLLFLFMGVVIYVNQKKDNFARLYFLTITIGLIIWILNTLLYFFWNWNSLVEIIVYGLNIVFFSLFFYTVIKLTENKKKIK